MHPMMHGVAEGVGNGFGEGLEFVSRRCVSCDAFFVDAVGTQQTPFVMIVAEPHVSDVFPAMIIGDFRRGEVIVVIDDGLVRCDLVVETACGFVVE